ncbi:MAG: HEAT repeat domain-containing protein [Candidatus Edwardsbacteria bacterium]
MLNENHQKITEASELLKSKNLTKRLLALETVSEIPIRETVALLIHSLQDTSWHVRECAAKSISKMGTMAVLPLLRLLKEGIWYTRVAAAEALGKIGDERAIPFLLEMLGDKNKSVCKAVREALLAIGSKDKEPLEKQEEWLGKLRQDWQSLPVSEKEQPAKISLCRIKKLRHLLRGIF